MVVSNLETEIEHKNFPIKSIEKSNHHNGSNIKKVGVKSGHSVLGTKPNRRFYIDELGFYRHLDPDHKQYICSNISANNLKQSTRSQSSSLNDKNRFANNEANGSGGSGYEVCFRAIRRDLGISHFDRTVDYESWKSGWDKFMQAKLASQQPVTLNLDLKNRIRSGIPHDYRCKVWTALIRMRTRNIRAQFGDDIYDAILKTFVLKVEVPDYSSDDNDFNNNNKPSINRQQPCRNGSSYIGPKTRAIPTRPVVRQQRSSLNDCDNPTTNNISYNSTSPTSTPNNRTNNNNFASQRPYTQEPLIDKCFKQIELDLLRTLPNNRHFEDPKSRGIQRVRRVLRAYACFNQTVGYCQGMNRLAAMALLVLPEEEAFWCLVAIIQCIMPKDYYLKPWLAQVDCCVLSDLLEKKMPKLHKHLVNNDIQLTLFTWFFTIFVDGFRPELMLRIWDCFLLEGDKVLFRFALSILYISQDDLLEMNDFSTMSARLSRLVSTRELDMEHLFETFSTMNPLSTGTIQSRREFHKARMQSMLDE